MKPNRITPFHGQSHKARGKKICPNCGKLFEDMLLGMPNKLCSDCFKRWQRNKFEAGVDKQ